MTADEVKKAQELKELGYSIREIGEVMDVPKSTIDRALRDSKGMGDLPGTAGTGGGSAELPVDREVALTSLKLSHERQMAQFNLDQQNLAVRRQEATNKAKELELQQQGLQQERDAFTERLTARKQALVSKHNRLVQELLDNCKKSTWEGEEIEEYLVRLDALQEKIQLFCDKQGIDEESLHIWQALLALEGFWEKQKEENTGFFSSSVDLDLGQKERADIKAWLVDDFDDLADDSPAEDDPADDELDDDDDEPDEETSEDEDDTEEDDEEEEDTRPYRRKR